MDWSRLAILFAVLVLAVGAWSVYRQGGGRGPGGMRG